MTATASDRIRLARMSEPVPMYGRRPLQQKAMGGRSYDGADTDAYSQRWAIHETAPDQELSGSLPALRSRSADLVRNNALAYGLISTIQHGVNGRGPRFRSEQADTALAEKINKLFDEWIDSAAWDGVSTWSDVCDDLVSSACISGDVLVIWPDIGDGTEPRVDLIDARRIDTPTDKTPECASCRLGVGYDKYGRVLGYYVKASDDSGTLRENYRWFPLDRGGRVNARLFKRPSVRRPRQSRGVGILAPILHQLKEVPSYLLTENRRATQAAKNFAIITSSDPQAIAEAFENVDPAIADGAGIDQLLGRSYGNIPDASMLTLGLGESATLAQPPSVNGGISDYVTAHLRTFASAADLPFEEAFRLYANLNMSNARTIRQIARATYRMWRDKVEASLCGPTADLLIRYWWANGKLGRIAWSDTLLDGDWHWDEMDWVDPQREVTSNADAIATGQKSIVDICASQGKDAYAIARENVALELYERDLRIAAGLPTKVVRRGVGDTTGSDPAPLPDPPTDTNGDANV